MDLSARDVYPDPSSEGPAFEFNTGQVVDDVAQFNPVVPDLGTPVSSDWDITQWGIASSYYDPTSYIVGDAAQYDPTLGLPSYTWESDSGRASFSVFKNQQYGNVYALSGSNEKSACNFMATLTSATGATFDKLITVSLDAKIGYAGVTGGNYGNSVAEIGFVVYFNAPGVPTLPVFIQYDLTSSLGKPWEDGTFSADGGSILDNNFPANTYLPFQTDTGPLHPISYDLNVAVEATAQNYSSIYGGVDSPLGAEYANLANWSLGGAYIGTEDLQSAIQLDFADFQVQTHDDVNFNPSLVGANGTIDYATSSAGTQLSYIDGGPVIVQSNGPDTIQAGVGPLTVHGGGSTLLVDGGVGSVSVDGAADLTFFGNEGAASIAATGSETIWAGAGNISVTGGGALSFYGGSGSATVTGGAGLEQILSGSGSLMNYGGDGPQTVDGGTGSGSLIDYGGFGSQTIDGGMGGTVVHGGGGNQYINAGTGSLVVFGGSGSQTVFGGSGPETIVGGTGHQVVLGGTGESSLWLGSAEGLYYAGSGENSVAICGGAQQTVVGVGAGDILGASKAGDDLIVGGAGSGEVLGVWSGGNDTVVTGAGNNSAVIESGSNVVVAGNGNSTIWSSTHGVIDGWNESGATNWVFNGQTSGNATINDFLVGKDRLLIQDAVSMPIVTESQGDSFIRLADGSTIELTNVSAPISKLIGLI